MILIWIVMIPVIGGLLARLSGSLGRSAPAWVSLGTLAVAFLLTVGLFAGAGESAAGRWLVEVKIPWIDQIGVSFHLAMDGLSLALVALTFFLGACAVVSSWTEVTQRAGLFQLNLMLTIAGITGAFLAMDLFLFYFFWELMLIPMFILIALWGHENRRYASLKFFIFTQAGSLLMLVAILVLFFIHGRATGEYTFSYEALLATPMGYTAEFLLMLAFFAAFAVKLPVFPFHTWLPEAHTEAPTAGSVILAGLLLKTGGYGLIRFVVPLFPEASVDFAPYAFGLAVIGIVYGAVLALGQRDIKRLVAYTSVSHMGFVLLGVYAWNELALQGALVQMVCHGVSTGALFMIAGALQERLHTRDLSKMGGLWAGAPRMGAVALVFALASLGLPGLGNFIGEFLVFLGVFTVSPEAAILAATGLVLSAIYSLWIIQRVFHGPLKTGIQDFGRREMAAFVPMIAVIVWLGLFPQPVLELFGQTLRALNVTASAPVETGSGVEKLDAGSAVYRISLTERGHK